ncbi:MAG TPA: hypothetical protein VNI77_00180 [Nitrososphaera sp.]|nr:hypothetical protein [Nitrososphaera sp.]
MPEIWLRYGSADVVLDIRFENLANQISATFPVMPDYQVASALGAVPLTDNMLMTVLSGSKSAARVITILAEQARANGFSFTVDVPQRFAGALRANLAGNDTISINRIDYPQSLRERMSKFQSTIIVSSVSYDPLFGFAGAPTVLLRNLLDDNKNKMAEAFAARKDNKPAPGVQGEPLKVAKSAVEGIAATATATSIEVVAGSGGVVGIHIGNINEAFDKAISQLKSISVIETDRVKCAIASASGEAGTHLTLANSLNSLWNMVHIVKEEGTAILVAEGREGVGGGAIQMFIEGRLKPEQLHLSPYIDGLEHLLFMEEVKQQKIELGLVSTLPHYYVRTKLGFSTYSSMKDILGRLSEKHGKNFRALVMSDADIVLLNPKA